MATNARYQNNDLRRQIGSPKPKGRGMSHDANTRKTDRVADTMGAENKDTQCRNVLIYGHCRFADQGCNFNHDTNKGKGNQSDL